ncbi:secreted RxLR effector protein 161-like [Lycium ferocissimum]|uniref:secreted RxLR effector protein 161-like n=1 Tax=Lycium ferocissimum TaxID=112874 RepID=UPI0028156A85|nr:secreted RxLR effector protein 161-like [Lycium ferocissimum]
MKNAKPIDTPIGSYIAKYDLTLGLCARFQSSPKESYLKAAKRILRYLKGSQDLVLFYPSGDNFDLVGYADVDYAGYLVDKKSTSGMAHFLGSCLISWGTRMQNSVALSTTEVEYVAVASCCAQLLWIKQQLEDFGVFTVCVPLMYDNSSALNMAKNLVHHKRTKHIDVRHYFLRDNGRRVYLHWHSQDNTSTEAIAYFRAIA